MHDRVTSHSVYPITASLVDWLNNELLPIEAGSFEYWRRLLPLVQICEDTLKGITPKYAALSAIDQYNERNNTTFTYEEILGRADYSFSGIGEWAAYTHLEDQQKILFGDHDDPTDAFDYADPSIQWIVVWLPQDEAVIVYRSPYMEGRQDFEDHECCCDGLERGSVLAYTLPPGIEGSIRQDLGA